MPGRAAPRCPVIRRLLLLAPVGALLLGLGTAGTATAQPAPPPTAPPATVPPTTAPAGSTPGSSIPPTVTPTSTPGGGPVVVLTTTTTSPAPSNEPGGGPGGLGWLFGGTDAMAAMIREAINDWFRDLIANAIRPALDLVARTVLATPPLTEPGGRVAELWRGMVLLVNANYAILLVLGGVTLMGSDSFEARYTVKQLAPRAVGGLALANLSLYLTGWGIQLSNALTRALLGQDGPTSNMGSTLSQLAIAPLEEGWVLIGVLQLIIVGLALVLFVTYAARILALIVLIPAGPLMLATLAWPPIAWLARLWGRCMAACLGVPVAQAFVLITALRVFVQADRARLLGGSHKLIDLVVVLALLWLLARIPLWAAKAAAQPQRSTVVRMVRSYVLVRVLRRSLGSPI